MSANSSIGWTDHTGGPWLICSEVSPGCVRCYARKLLERMFGPIIRKAYRLAGLEDWETRPIWGDKAPRVLTKGFWRDARRLNKKAVKEGKRFKIFPSMIDWLDEMPAGIIDQDGNWLNRDEVFAEFLAVVHECQNLDWLLLTKRPENWLQRMAPAYATRFVQRHSGGLHTWMEEWRDGNPPLNVWIGFSAERQKEFNDRALYALAIPAAIRFVSCEPLLGPINLIGPIDGQMAYPLGRGIHWVIIGGETGAGFREMHVGVAIAMAEQCVAYEVPVFMKQDSGLYPGKQGRIPNEWWRHEWPAKTPTAQRPTPNVQLEGAAT